MSDYLKNIVDGVNANSSGASKRSGQSATAEMSERFMTLFMAQLRNQDPLNPLDNTEMTSQLAQMNMVSGLESLNASMQTLLGAYNEALTLQAANLIGRNVLVPGSDMTLTDQGALFGLNLQGPADEVEVTIYDQYGNVVTRQSLGQQSPGAMAFFWDGKDTQGNSIIEQMSVEGENGERQFTPIQYRFTVSASMNGEPVVASPLQAGMVSALIRGTNGFSLEILGLGNRTMDDVKQVF